MKKKKEIRIDFYFKNYNGTKTLGTENYNSKIEKSLNDNLLYTIQEYFYYYINNYLPKLAILLNTPFDGRWWRNDILEIYSSIGDDTFIKYYLNGKYQETDSKIIYKTFKKYKDKWLVKDKKWKTIKQQKYNDSKYYDDLGNYNLNLYHDLIEYYKSNGFDELIYIYEDLDYCNDNTCRHFKGSNWKLSLFIYNFAYKMLKEQDKDIKNKEIKFIKYKIDYNTFTYDFSKEHNSKEFTEAHNKYIKERNDHFEQELYRKAYEDYKKYGVDKIIIPIPDCYIIDSTSTTAFKFNNIDWDKSIETYKKACKDLNNNQINNNLSQVKEVTHTNEFDYTNNSVIHKIRVRKKEVKQNA